jgi:hypothetical protein
MKAGIDDAVRNGVHADFENIEHGPESEEAIGPELTFPLLRDLRERPELFAPPEEVLPRFVWRSRTTGLVGIDKGGKSTLAAHGAAAKSNGSRFLGGGVEVGTVVVAAPDEAIGDTVRRLDELGANPDRVRVMALRPPDLLGTLGALLREHPADFAVIDSLAEWARLTMGRAPEDGDAAGWGAVVRPLVQLSRDHDLGLLLLHHPRRSDGQYRGSGEIAAALDCLIEMTMPQATEDPTLRRFRGRARWPVEDFSLRLNDGRYEVGGGGPVPVEARIVMDTAAHPGTSRNAQHGRIGGRKQTYLAAVNRLLEDGGLIDRESKLYLPDDVEVDVL